MSTTETVSDQRHAALAFDRVDEDAESPGLVLDEDADVYFGVW